MPRRAILPILIIVATTLVLMLSLTPAGATVSNLRTANTTCASAQVTIAYDGVTGGSGANSLRFRAFRVTGTGDAQISSLQVPVPASAQDSAAALTWITEPNNTTIRLTVEQIDSIGTVLSSASVTYICGGGSVPGASATPTATPTGIPAGDREAAAGVSRLYDDLLTAVIFRMSNGDVQFYHFRGAEGVFVGNVPAAQMNPALYQPGQRVAQFTSGVTSWRVDFYFHGWDAWHAVYFDNTGAQRADAWFHYGDPNAGLPPGAAPQPGQVGQPGQGGGIVPGGVPTLVPGFVVPFPTLFPRGVVSPTLPAIVQQGQVIAVPLVGNLSAYARVPLSLRAAPSTGSRRLNVIPAGTPVSLTARDASGQWALGVLPGGQYGWLATRYLSVNLAQIMGLPVVSG